MSAPWRRPDWRGGCFGFLAIALACTVSFAVVAAVPVPITIMGERAEAPPGSTVKAVLGSLRQPEAGDLIDVNGELLEAGAGMPGAYLLNGVECWPDAQVRPGDAVDIRPGDDIVETIIIEDQLTPAPMELKGSGSFVVVRDQGQPARTTISRGVVTGRVFGEEEKVAAKPLSVMRVQYRPGGKKVVLTLDDGPSRPYTSDILDVLKAEGVPAVFFMLGANVVARPNLVKRIADEGHELANHSYSHTINEESSQAEIEAEIEQTAKAVEAATGLTTMWFRPPGGALSANMVRAAEALNHKIALWNIDSLDWRTVGGKPSADTIAHRVLNPLPESGSVMLFHDGGGDRRATVQALSRIIRTLKDQGYEFCTLTELAEAAGLRLGS